MDPQPADTNAIKSAADCVVWQVRIKNDGNAKYSAATTHACTLHIKNPAIIARGESRSSVRSGNASTCPLDFRFSNSAVSPTCRRTKYANTPMQLPKKNARRHAQLMACSCPNTEEIISATTCPSSNPEFTPASKMDVTKPARRGPACSLSQHSDDGISPPSAIPCTSRSTTSNIGAAIPSVA